MTRTNTTEVQAGKASRPKTALAGTPEPEDPENCYVVDPGENGPEYFRPVLAAKENGLEAAVSRARFLSFTSGVPQKVTRRCPDPGTPDSTFIRYVNGQGISLVRKG